MSQKHKNSPPPPPPAEAEPAPAVAAEAKEAGPGVGWKLAGVGLAVVAALLCGAVYQQMQRQVRELRQELGQVGGELRKDLGQLNQSKGTLVKKHDHDGRVRQVWDSLKELRADRSDLTMLKERCAGLQEQLKSADEERRQLAAEVQRLRQRKSGEDERQTLAREIRSLRERIAGLEGSKPAVMPAGHAEEPPRP